MAHNENEATSSTPDTRHALIFIHGIGQEDATHGSTKDYELLYSRIRTEWHLMNPTKRFDSYFRRVDVNWLSVTDPQEELLYTSAYGQKPSKGFWVSLLRGKLMESINTFAITKAGDVIAYTDDHDNGIRVAVWQQIEPICSLATYSIIAHSLGSVIAYDYVYALFTDKVFASQNVTNRPESTAKIYSQNFKGLFTFGSPIGIFLLRRFNLFVMRNSIESSTIAVQNPVTNSIPWINFYSKLDPIAQPLAGIFPKNQGCFPKDVRVRCGWLPIIAHIGYWKNKIMAREIAKNL